MCKSERDRCSDDRANTTAAGGGGASNGDCESGSGRIDGTTRRAVRGRGRASARHAGRQAGRHPTHAWLLSWPDDDDDDDGHRPHA
ncbi:hypothetical protein GUJ93_ZPchr0004g40416 [Zizania palustris]|uniref:Uncharacterized protein n=1 Tax=Zizania palustris TaxID=103762 RepID=A0A8J5S7D6_ZIZPA|nr:hypothetical protein GUJ93_ZPchr0004g40416 [Zizania palustris]